MPLSLLHANDELGKHAPSWYAATANCIKKHSKLEGDLSFDVVVIGGGYAGLSSAYHLSLLGYSVCLLEAHRIGWGASGRNGGQVASGQRQDQITLEKLVGGKLAHEAFDIGVDAAKLVRKLIADHKIDCQYQPGVIEANHKSKYDAESEFYVEKLSREYSYETLSYLSPDQMAQKVGSLNYSGGSIDTASGHLHPLNYAVGLAEAAVNAGATLFEHSEVTEIIEGKDKQVMKTGAGKVTADIVVSACNGYQSGIRGDIETRVMPINNFIIATEPMSNEFANGLIRDREAVCDSRHVVNYFRLSDDNRMLFGGGENYSYKFPNDIKEFVRPKMLQIFPQLQDTQIEYGWGGTLGITVNRVPDFSFENGRLNISGFSGSGIAMATMAGKIAAEAIHGHMAKFDVMSALPTPNFPGGALLRWPTLVAAMLWFSLRDRL